MGAVPRSFGVIGRFFGNTVSAATGYAFGVATGPVLAPAVEELRQLAWSTYANRVPDVGTLAAGVAEGHVDEAAVLAWAKAHGFGQDVFESLCRLRGTGPGVSLAFEMRRRGLISEAELRTALKRQAIEDDWIDALVALTRVLLSPSELANAVVQGFRDQDTARADAALWGISGPDFDTMVNVTGLPPGPETMLEWLRRGITDEAGVIQAIREGHTKVKYVDEYLEARWRVLSAAEYAGLHLRGWITEPEMVAGGAKTGFTAADMQLLFLNRGRPATTRQVHIGFQRGGRLPAAGNDERATFETAVKQSNIRPEWTDILWSQRYTYPSAFVVRGLTTSGQLTEAEADEILRFSGWEPTLAGKVAALWSGGSGGGGSKWPDRARSRLFTVTHNEYLDYSLDEGEAKAELTRVGVPVGEQDTIVGLWAAERAISRLELTPAQIKKAYAKGLYTQTTAVAELEERGMTAADALTYLTE